jgi:hypothetical protein
MEIPERVLWMSVLQQAVMDALRAPRPTHPLVAAAVFYAENDRDQARAWIEGGGKDFREVCTLAGVDPEWVQRMYAEGRARAPKLRTVRRFAEGGNVPANIRGSI